MKQLTKTLGQLLCIAMLLLGWNHVQALETFQQAGMMQNIEYEKFSLRGKSYRLAPKVEIISDDASRGQFSDFKPGDVIYLEGRVLDGVRYVDIIRYEAPVPN